ncbi:c-type cytochrome [Variovorax arabinosiphilus]|uniref:c-type cytochrome n=1 Tax=Variovorax arabinosiphilus TaxID=3053498 RepID=UPI002575D6E3|nr:MULTISPECIES: cytochrome c [unclassified Variovorax]MDM0121717.1 cytochrome c [Variovorax sp. J2L1-78]MDM0130778.1 cytochrome c [Variovorax sp. J2L1-63]MDM0234480.1 cytochrome c [Variovorax sp. J2R1-6]
MKRLSMVIVALLVVGAALYVFLTRSDTSPGQAPVLAGAPADAAVLVRGEYLTKAADCIACHTVAGGKGQPFAGGVPFKLPFGTIYSSNITADPDTGIGRWTDDQFVRALHDGVRSDGQRLYPAFPYTSYTQLSRSDVLAIKAYLFSLPTVSQPNQPADLSFPFNQRWAMGFWNAAFFKSERFVADAAKPAEWNKGAYLATALGHCAECHTPRNLAFALDKGNDLAGAELQGWRAYNITSDPKAGVGAWSDAQLASYLSTGHADGRGSAGGPMGEAVEHSLQHLKAEDVAALVTYLRSVPARQGKSPIDIDTKAPWAVTASAAAPAGNTAEGHEMGLKLFAAACASCHQWNGKGQQTPYAGLLGTRGVNDPEGANVTQMILQGVNMHVGKNHVYMPAFGKAYTDTEVAALANYVMAQFGNKAGRVTPEMVAEQRTK